MAAENAVKVHVFILETYIIGTYTYAIFWCIYASLVIKGLIHYCCYIVNHSHFNWEGFST